MHHQQQDPYAGGGGRWGQPQVQPQHQHQPWGIPGGINANNGKIETASDVFRKEREANGDAVEGGDGDDDER